MAIDKFGRTHVVWKGLDSSVWYAMLDPNGTLKVPAFKLYSRVMDAAPRVAVDDHGAAHVVTTTLVGSYLDYVKVSEGRRVAGNAFHLYVPGGFYESERDTRPSIAIHPATQLPVIAAEVRASWSQDVGGVPVYYYDNYIVVVTLDLTKLQPTGNPDPAAVYAPFGIRDTISEDFRAQSPEVTVDSEGTIHCVWLHRDPAWEGSGVGYWRPGQVWREIAAIRDVAGDTGRPRITARKVGFVDVVWSTASGSVLWHEMDNQGQPVPERNNLRLSAPTARASRPQIGAGVQSVCFAWLDQREGASQLYSLSPEEDTTERNVICGADAVFNPGVASHRFGALAYVWHQAHEGRAHVFFRCEKVIRTYDPRTPLPEARSITIQPEVPPETPPSVARISGNNFDRHVEHALLLKIVTDFPDSNLRLYVQPVACSGGHRHDAVTDSVECPTLAVDEAVEKDTVETIVDRTRRHGLLRRDWSPQTSPLKDPEWPLDEYDKRATGTLDHGDLASSFKDAKTDTNGVAWVYYIAPEIGGDEVVTVVYGEEPLVSKAQLHISVAVPGLEPLAESGTVHLIGDTGSHPENHYGTHELLLAIDALSRNFAQDKTYFPVAGQNESLRVNDMSLPQGGAFDIGPPSYGPYWGYGQKPRLNHFGHKRGYEVDIGIPPDNDAFLNKELYFGEEIVEKQGWWVNDPRLWTAEGNHYHLMLAGTGGKPSIVFSAAVVEEPWNPATRRIRVALPYENQGGIEAAEVGITAIRASEGTTVLRVNSVSVEQSLQGTSIEPVCAVPERYLSLGPAAIRSPQKLEVEALVSSELPWFALQWTGFATRPTDPWLPYPLYPTVGMGWVNARPRVASMASPGPAGPGGQMLQVRLFTPSQPAQAGVAVVYEGEIQNVLGTPVALSGGSLTVRAKLPPQTLGCEFAPELLATGGLIGTGGYRGPLLRLIWGAEVPDGTVVSGTIEFVLGPGVTFTTLPESFYAFLNPPSLRISRSGEHILLAWPKAAAGLFLQRTDDLAAGEWVRDYLPVVEDGADNTVVTDPSEEALFFRLHP